MVVLECHTFSLEDAQLQHQVSCLEDARLRRQLASLEGARLRQQLASLEGASLWRHVSSCQAVTLRHQVVGANQREIVSSWEVASLRLHAQHTECVQKQEARKLSILYCQEVTRGNRVANYTNVLDAMPLQWRTPDIPAGYFVTTSRSKYAQESTDMGQFLLKIDLWMNL